MEPQVQESIVSAGLGRRRDPGRVGRHTRDTITHQHLFHLAGKPRLVSRLEDYISIESCSQGIEESPRQRIVEGKARWQLHEHWSELGTKAGYFAEEALQGCDEIDESAFVSDHFGKLHREPKIRRHGCRPPLISGKTMRPIKTGIDLHRVEERRETLEMTAQLGETMSVLPPDAPARDPETNVSCGRLVWNIVVRAHTFRHMVAKSLLALLFVTACTSAPRSARSSSDANYWEALSRLQVGTAITVARNSAERQFAESLNSLMTGDVANAEKGFDALRGSAADSVIRSGSRVMHIATLQYQEKWAELAELARDTLRLRTVKPDKAGIELWALAFSRLPPRTSEFRARTATLPMSISAVGTPLIPVLIGAREYHFWLDTGSSMTMLASDVAKSIGVDPLMGDTLEIVTSTGRIVAQPGVIPELRLGQFVVRNVPTMIVDEAMMRMRELKPLGEGSHLKIDGIIGFDIIRQLDIEVDYSAALLKLRDPAYSSRTRERNMFWVGLPVVQLVSTQGIPLHFALDTGSQLTFVTETLLDKLQLQATRVENRKVGGLGGEISMRAPVLSYLRVRLRGISIFFRGAVVRAPVYQVLVALDGVLGGDIWKTGAVRIDVTNGVFAVGRPIRD